MDESDCFDLTFSFQQEAVGKKKEKKSVRKNLPALSILQYVVPYGLITTSVWIEGRPNQVTIFFSTEISEFVAKINEKEP